MQSKKHRAEQQSPFRKQGNFFAIFHESLHCKFPSNQIRFVCSEWSRCWLWIHVGRPGNGTGVICKVTVQKLGTLDLKGNLNMVDMKIQTDHLWIMQVQHTQHNLQRVLLSPHTLQLHKTLFSDILSKAATRD